MHSLLHSLRLKLCCLGVTALLASCAMFDDSIPLPEGRWEMIESSFLEIGRLPGIKRATLQIGNGRLAAFSGCNNVSATVASVDGKMAVSAPMASTRRACIEPMGGFEASYFRLLRNRPYFRTEGDVLILADGDDSARFRRIAEPVQKK